MRKPRRIRLRPAINRGKNPLGSIWKNPPRTETPVIRGREAFPGKSFLEKGAEWLVAEQTNFSPAQRKIFAKKCFNEAIRLCNIRFQKARKHGPKAEAQRLGEIITWIDLQYIKTL